MNLCAWTAEKLSNSFPPVFVTGGFTSPRTAGWRPNNILVAKCSLDPWLRCVILTLYNDQPCQLMVNKKKTFITELLLQHTTSSATSFLSPRRYSKCDEYGVWTLMVGPQAKQDLLQFLFALQFDSTKIDSNSTWSYWDLCLIFRLLRFNL